jgi:hypothetical protein
LWFSQILIHSQSPLLSLSSKASYFKEKSNAKEIFLDIWILPVHLLERKLCPAKKYKHKDVRFSSKQTDVLITSPRA